MDSQKNPNQTSGAKKTILKKIEDEFGTWIARSLIAGISAVVIIAATGFTLYFKPKLESYIRETVAIDQAPKLTETEIRAIVQEELKNRKSDIKMEGIGSGRDWDNHSDGDYFFPEKCVYRIVVTKGSIGDQDYKDHTFYPTLVSSRRLSVDFSGTSNLNVIQASARDGQPYGFTVQVQKKCLDRG